MKRSILCLDVQIQQEIPYVLSALLLDVLVSVIPPLTTTTTTLTTPLIATPIPTPPIISTATTTTPTVPDLLLAVVQRVSALQKEVKELKQVDHSIAVLASVRSHVPLVMDAYLGSTLGDTLQKVLQKYIEELIQQFPQTSVSEIMKSYERHPTHKALYDALLESIFVDENDMDRLAVDHASHRKRQYKDKDEEPSAGSDQGKKKESKETNLNLQRNLLLLRNLQKVEMDVEEPTQENAEDNVDQPQSKDAPKTSKIPNKDWFKQPPRPPTPDPEWNTVQTISDELEQTWFKDLMRAEKPPLTFDELMAIPIDFLTLQ
ncbi:hypothetical protein Tco_0143546 [Tanacetum coccineum]